MRPEVVRIQLQGAAKLALGLFQLAAAVALVSHEEMILRVVVGLGREGLERWLADAGAQLADLQRWLESLPSV